MAENELEWKEKRILFKVVKEFPLLTKFGPGNTGGSYTAVLINIIYFCNL